MANRICTWISEGKTLRAFCRQQGTPSYATVYDWLDARPEFATRFGRAREVGADVIGDEIMEIADTQPGRTNTGGRDSADVAWRRAQVEARLKLLAKWSPKKWGEKATVTHEGGDKPLQVEELTPLQAARKIAFTLALAQENLKKDSGDGS